VCCSVAARRSRGSRAAPRSSDAAGAVLTERPVLV
jgi:hypothetical protein